MTIPGSQFLNAPPLLSSPSSPPAPTSDQGKTYSYAALEGAWINAGGDPSLAPIAAAIAMAESNGSQIYQSGMPIGGPQTGCCAWQITPCQPGVIDSIALCAQAAVSKYVNAPGGGHNFSPWTTFTGGAYQAFVQNGVAPDLSVTAALAGLNIPGSGLLQIPGEITKSFQDIGKVFSVIFNAAFWKRLGIGLAGAAILIGGLALFMVTTKEGSKLETQGTEAAVGLAALA